MRKCHYFKIQRNKNQSQDLTQNKQKHGLRLAIVKTNRMRTVNQLSLHSTKQRNIYIPQYQNQQVKK
jgi:hypothetical protein